MYPLILVVGLFVIQFYCVANASSVFSVERKFKVSHSNFDNIKIHDSRRHGRLLSAIDFPLAGHSSPFFTGLYYTKLGLGTPVKDFYVQVDTGSDNLWVNCVGCTTCPKYSGLGMDLTLYDPNDSKTSDLVSCHDDFCTDPYDDRPILGCKKNMPCRYKVWYEDGSIASGFYVKDYLSFDHINGNPHTVLENGTVNFGCGVRTLQSSPSHALDGIMGFGHGNSSVLSQLAASGKVKRIFSHCLDSINGGGMFSIGEVVAPKFNTTPFIPRMELYNLVLKDIEIDGEVVQLPMDMFHTKNGTRTLIDSGTTLAYLPASAYDRMVTKILARQPALELYLYENQLTCFHHSNNIDDGFPVVKFRFEGLFLTVYPHNYLLFSNDDDIWCLGWQRSPADNNLIILGDLVLSNKLVIYDLEKMTIGWTDYNCSTSIKVKDDEIGSVYKVVHHKFILLQLPHRQLPLS